MEPCYLPWEVIKELKHYSTQQGMDEQGCNRLKNLLRTVPDDRLQVQWLVRSALCSRLHRQCQLASSSRAAAAATTAMTTCTFRGGCLFCRSQCSYSCTGLPALATLHCSTC
jgi:hypothetical protein